MNIEDYLKKYGITKRGFARRLEITESALHKIISGINSPRTTTAQEIVELTNSEVTFQEKGIKINDFSLMAMCDGMGVLCSSFFCGSRV